MALLSIMSVLFACGGGGGSSDNSNQTPTDTIAPTVTAFTMTAPATGQTVTVTTFTATDATGVTGYMITPTATAPTASDAGWTAVAPTSFTFNATTTGSQTAYAWAKDAAGNVSASKSAAVTITVSTAAARAVSGVVTNPVSGAPVSGATVSVFIQLGSVVAKSVAAPVLTGITGADGSYLIPGLLAGTTYYFQITASGFAPFNYYNINPDANSPLTLETARIIPSSIAGLTATASGKVKNASTNAGLPGMTVKIRSGVNNTTGTVVGSPATTDATGAYSFASLAAGTYTAEVTGNIGSAPIITAYFTLVSIPNSSSLNGNQDFAVTAGVNSSQYRIVLSWGNAPSDLDSYLTGPKADGTRFNMGYHYDFDYPSGTTTRSTDPTTFQTIRVAGTATEAFVDVDNTSHGTSSSSNNGPETTTIVVPRSGNYKFYVHNYSSGTTSNISASGAQVKVYKGSSLLATYNPPSGAVGHDDVWAVFSMTVSGSGETITPINQIFVGAGTSNLDGLTGGSCPSGTFTNKLTIGTGFNGSDITGTGSSFSIAALANSGDLYARIESASSFTSTSGNRFARLYINGGTYGQKDFCATCNAGALLSCPNVIIGKFRITDVGSWALTSFSVPMAGGSESALGSTNISTSN